MGCDAQLAPITVLFWCLPFHAGYWIRRRKQVAGASLFLGRLILILWVAALVIPILSIFLGFSKLEGNPMDSACWTMFAILVALTTAHALLFLTLKVGLGAGDGES